MLHFFAKALKFRPLVLIQRTVRLAVSVASSLLHSFPQRHLVNADTACNFGDRAAIIDDQTYRVGLVVPHRVV